MKKSLQCWILVFLISALLLSGCTTSQLKNTESGSNTNIVNTQSNSEVNVEKSDSEEKKIQQKENSTINPQSSQEQLGETVSSKNLKDIIIQGDDLSTEWKYNNIKILNESLQHPIQHYDISFTLSKNDEAISRSGITEYSWDTVAVVGHKLYMFSSIERTDEVYNHIVNLIKEKRGYTEIASGVKAESFGFYIRNEKCKACATIIFKKSNIISILFHGRVAGHPGTSFRYLGASIIEDTNKKIEKKI